MTQFEDCFELRQVSNFDRGQCNADHSFFKVETPMRDRSENVVLLENCGAGTAATTTYLNSSYFRSLSTNLVKSSCEISMQPWSSLSHNERSTIVRKYLYKETGQQSVFIVQEYWKKVEIEVTRDSMDIFRCGKKTLK